MTFISSLFYLKAWISQLADSSYLPRSAIQSCISLQNTLLSSVHIPAEHRWIIEELRKTMHKDIAQHLPRKYFAESRAVQDTIYQVYGVFSKSTKIFIGGEDAENCKHQLLKPPSLL